MKYKIIMLALAALITACSSIPSASVVLSKAKTVTALLTLESSTRTAYRAIIVDLNNFSDEDVIEIQHAWQNITDFRLSIQRMGKRDNIVLSVQDFTSRLKTFRSEVSRIAVVMDRNYNSLSPESKAGYIEAIGNYNRISTELDERLARGDNKQAVDQFILSVESAAAMAGVFL